jgi:phytoene dehydrogenase-like protein
LSSAPDAVVIGAGHNGLVAANVLADHGWSVVVHEAEDEPGGSVRSGELIEPGFVHDFFSAFYPLGAASPVFRALELEIPWRHGPVVVAHPGRDGSCAVLERDDGPELWRRIEPAVLRAMTTPFPQVRAGLQLALEPEAARLLAFPSDPLERRIRIGNALHTDAAPTSLTGRAFGMLLTNFGRRYGYPCVEGGAGRITDALVERAVARGVEIRCGSRLEHVPAARRAVVGAIPIWGLAALLGREAGVIPDPATLKLDWTLDGPVPWAAADARRSPVVHIGGPGTFVLFGQYSMADPSRAPAGKETAWAYTHDLQSAEAVEAKIEELAPGFRSLIRGRHVAELPPGRISGGRTRLRLRRPEVAEGVFLGSLSAHPGGGVHGAPGWIAAQAALRASSRRRARGLVSFTSSSR